MFTYNGIVGKQSNEDTIRVWEPFGVEGGSSARRSVTYRFAKTGEGIELSIFRVPQEGALARPIDTTPSFLHKRIPVRFVTPSSTQSWESIGQTKQWLKNCLENHQPACSPLVDHELLPKRLIRVWKSGSRYHVQLVEPENKVEYFCLSYRWGIGHASCTTVKANLVARKNAIPWDGLPTVLRQALEFTYKLGGEYLWIDSLCIIQDDVLDWSNESKKMAGIYKSAILTLAASCAEDSDEDLFYSPSKTEIGIKVEGLGRFGVTDDIFVRALAPHRLEVFPLHRRAWVYQERLLSPRYLHFSLVELIWECNTGIFCQCSGEDIKSERGMGEKTIGRFAKASFWWGIEWDKEQKAFRLKEHMKGSSWNKVVQEYSSHSITYRKDRLPAISGIAKQFRELGQNSDYLAGLWKDTFFENLMWHASFRSASMTRSTEWIAPTWSWSSVGAGVQFFGEPWVDLEISNRVSLLDALCEPVYGDDTMNLKFASMTIRGPSFSATVEQKGDNGGYVTYVLTREGVKPGNFDVDYDLSEPGDFHVSLGSEVLCIEVGNVTIYGDLGFGMHALVLRRLSSGKHERIGIVEWGEDIRSISDASETATFVVV
ncbi:MAG: hypothetical protein M1813_005924 [Trichoglossum hirsutum]|nr:MAG: hypothetical protein M1813_005924 [Trichoglossum hirsutum]